MITAGAVRRGAGLSLDSWSQPDTIVINGELGTVSLGQLQVPGKVDENGAPQFLCGKLTESFMQVDTPSGLALEMRTNGAASASLYVNKDRPTLFELGSSGGVSQLRSDQGGVVDVGAIESK